MDPRSLTEPLRETLAVFDAAGEPLTTREVADHLDPGRRTVSSRLDRLAGRGRLATKTVGETGRVWWRPSAHEGGSAHEPERQRREVGGRSVRDSLAESPGPVPDGEGGTVAAPGTSGSVADRPEEEPGHRGEQLAASNSLTDAVRDLTTAVIEQSSREEIEATVCEHLAASDACLFAWIGEVDAATRTVEVRAEAGVEGYLDGVTITVDPDDERGLGPTGTALRTGEVDVVDDVRAESRHDPWRETVEAHEFKSSAAIPIVHEDAVYGVINVYAERSLVFTDRERETLARLGRIVGHAVAAAERKRALMSDDLVELEFRIEDAFRGDASAEIPGTITMDHTVAVGGGEYVVYGTATSDAAGAVDELLESVPYLESVTVRSGGDPVRFEARLVDPPVLSAVASRGGSVRTAVVEDGDYRLTVHLAPTVAVRGVVDAVEEVYANAELLTRRQVSRTDDDLRGLSGTSADLTDRQRSALQAAYHAGYFEWPRDASGEEVAESLGVAPATFHQHLRKAERKVLDAVVSPPATPTE